MQRDLHDKEEADAQVTIRKEGGEIIELTAAEHNAFVSAVAPIFDEAGKQYGRELMKLVNR
jgi:TRAP-type C4-dicarboxylate transport system substrate-binding protein